MESRRKFIAQGSLAAAAITVLNPLKTFAGSNIGSALGLSCNDNKLVVLHTGTNTEYAGYASEKISLLKKKTENILLLKEEQDLLDFEGNYQVLYRGNIKTGIIKTDKNSTAKQLDALCSYLKKEKGCQLTVCISSFGFKDAKSICDTKLAGQTEHIDIIIGKHATNYSRFPVVLKNKRRKEVVIHSATDNGFGLGNIEIAYDPRTNDRNSLAFNNLLNRLPETS